MKKKAMMEAFNVLIAIAVIATAFLIFYAWYAALPKELAGTIAERTADIKDSGTLVRLLSTPVEGQQTIADLIVVRKTEEAALGIKSTLSALYGPNILYVLKLDGRIIAKTDVLPENPLSQEAFLPGLDHEVLKISLEFGI